MYGELERITTEAVMACFKMTSQLFPKMAKETQKKSETRLKSVTVKPLFMGSLGNRGCEH
jgi:hypothetical protein